MENTHMLFGDAKTVLTQVNKELASEAAPG
jgi:NAD/NADP transhydrogenase beta subunit